MSKEWEIRRMAATPRGVGTTCPFYAAKAKNAEIWDVEGNRYVDFTGGIGVLNAGHLHPKVQAAIAEQLEKFSHICYMVVPYDLYVRAAERINALVPGRTPKKTAFFSTGAEAVENAVKIARCHTGRPGVIAFQGSFHGRTLLTLALTGKVSPYKTGFGPFPPDIYHVPFPSAVHGVSVHDSVKAIRALFASTIEAERVAAILIEPVQGEGGFHVVPKEFIVALRALCDEYGILLIHDEIQCGFGRTGKLFATEHYGIEPDIITMAKSLGGGFPVSAVTGKAAVMDAPAPGGLGGTYAGHPLGMAAVNAILDVFEEENLCERSRILGEICMRRLKSLENALPGIREVRGLGSMIAVEFMKPGTDEPDSGTAKKIQTLARENGLLLLTCGPHHNIIRLLYPLTIEDALFDQTMTVLENSIRECLGTGAGLVCG
jgi:4-aminobutyrate aminotransferase